MKHQQTKADHDDKKSELPIMSHRQQYTNPILTEMNQS